MTLAAIFCAGDWAEETVKLIKASITIVFFIMQAFNRRTTIYKGIK
jgi:hypothetical protein